MVDYLETIEVYAIKVGIYESFYKSGEILSLPKFFVYLSSSSVTLPLVA